MYSVVVVRRVEKKEVSGNDRESGDFDGVGLGRRE